MDNALIKEIRDDLMPRLQGKEARADDSRSTHELIRELRTALGLSISAFAKRMDVTVGTVNKWERGTLPGQSQFERFQAIFETALSTSPKSIESEIRQRSPGETRERLGIRDLDYILQLMSLADHVWLAKYDRPFLAGEHARVRSQIIDILSTPPPGNDNQQVEFHYVYIKGKDGSNDKHTEAEESYMRLKSFIDDNFEGLKDRIKPHPIKSTPAAICNLGVTAIASWIVIEYRREWRKQFRRPFDVFIELPNRRYKAMSDRVSGKIEEIEGSASTVYVELPEDIGLDCWDIWRKAIDSHSFDDPDKTSGA